MGPGSRRLGLALLTGTLALAFAGPVPAQDTTQSPPESKRVVTRTGMTGTWERMQRGTGGQAAAVPAGVVVPPRIQTAPLKPQHLAAYRATEKAMRDADARGQPLALNTVTCLPEGMFGMMNALFPMEVLETPGQVTIVQEYLSQVRRIYLDDDSLGPPEDLEPVWYGHSSGRWEGDVLVVDTVRVKEIARFRQGTEPMVPHSLDMRINERFRLVHPDYLQNEVTITDPAYLSEPWRFTYLYRRAPGYKIQEYVCEDNHAYVDAEGRTFLDFGDGKGPR